METQSLKPELLLFDFGGVLVEFAGPNELGQSPPLAVDARGHPRALDKCPHTDEFERGQLSPAEWAERFIRDWDVDLRPDAFLAKFTTWSRRVLPGAKELLEQLRPHYRLAALSNSNELHWERNTNELRILELFEFAISSHQVRIRLNQHPRLAGLDRSRNLPPTSAAKIRVQAARVESSARAVSIAAYGYFARFRFSLQSPMRPADTEFAPFYASYIARVPETDPVPVLEAQPAERTPRRPHNAGDEPIGTRSANGAYGRSSAT